MLFVIPGMLYLCDGLIEKTTFKVHFYRKNKKENNLISRNKFIKKINQN